jgi:hypothetical protein
MIAAFQTFVPIFWAKIIKKGGEKVSVHIISCHVRSDHYLIEMFCFTEIDLPSIGH